MSSEPDVDIFGITVSMREHHDFETIFNSNDVINIKYGTGK